MSACILLAGEPLVLRQDRSIYWPGRKTLLLADPHWGKAESFQSWGVPIAVDARDSLDRLTSAIQETGAERLVVLGDFWHARAGRTDELADRLSEWKRSQTSLTVSLLRGNHDRAGAPPFGWGDWQDELVESPFVFRHHPQPSSLGYTLAGHIHPGVILRGRGREKLVLPAYRLGPSVGILPAFGSFTGLAASPPQAGERIFAIAGDEVIEV